MMIIIIIIIIIINGVKCLHTAIYGFRCLLLSEIRFPGLSDFQIKCMTVGKRPHLVPYPTTARRYYTHMSDVSE